jgi:hypothetical protein
MRTAQEKYSALRYNVWHLARRAQLGDELPDDVLDAIVNETADSQDDRRWDEAGWVE